MKWLILACSSSSIGAIVKDSEEVVSKAEEVVKELKVHWGKAFKRKQVCQLTMETWLRSLPQFGQEEAEKSDEDDNASEYR